MTKIIKRYSNRKLYDTERSTYITLEEIRDMVRDGEDIRIIDNSTKEDLTNVTLAQIIFEQEKAHKRLLPLSSLRYIIQQSGEDLMQRIQSPVTQFRDEVKRKADVLEEGSKALRDFIDGTQRSLDDMQNKVDERMRDAIDQMTHIPEMRNDMRVMEIRMRELEATVQRLESLVRERQPSRSPIASDPFRDLP
ncbi:MAG: polyhydroxyalkanoate synthesis regulator DNA-binding domain-containing protein [bacterium]